MIPISLHLKDFGSYVDAEIPLAGIGLAAVVGANGSGKSTLLDGVRVALYGAAVAPLAGFIRQGAGGFSVTCSFVVDGQEYRVVREQGKAQRATLMRVEGPVGSTIAEGATQVDSAIRDLLGCDYQTFALAHWLRQGELGRLVGMQAAERKKWLAGVLPLQEVMSLEAAAKRQAKLYASDGDKIAAVLENVPDSEVLATVEQDLSDGESARFQNATLLSRLESDLEVARKENEAVESWRSALRVAVTKNAAAQDAMVSARRAFEDQQTRVVALKALVQVPVMDHRPIEEIEAEHQEALQSEASAGRARDAAAALTKAEAALQSATAAIKALETRDECICPTCGQTLGDEALAMTRGALEVTLAGAEYDYAEARERLEAIPVVSNDRSAADLKEELDFARNFEQAEAERKSRAQDLPGEELRLSTLQTTRERAEADYENAHAEMVKLNNSQPPATDTDRLEGRIRELRPILSENERQVARLEERARSMRDEIEKAEAQRRELEVLRELQSDAQILAEAYGKNGLQARMMVEAVAFIEAEANTFLGRFTSGMTVELSMTKQIGSGEMRDTLDILVSDAMGVRAIDTFSGGERTRVNFALAVAIGRLLSAQNDTHVQSFVVDEPEYLDAEGVAELSACLQVLSQSCPFVVLVSHVGGAVDSMPQRLAVTKGERGSKVTVQE